MFRRLLYKAIVLSALVSIGGVGCAHKKKKTSVSEDAPPAAAYPDGESQGAAGQLNQPASSVPGQTSGYASTGTTPTPASSRSSEPPPFELRSDEQLTIYQVGSGDTLDVIATKYGTTTSRIMAANGMSDTRIYAGKSINVPTAAATPTSNSSVAPISAPAPATSTGYLPTPAPRSVSSIPYSTPSSPAPSSNASSGYTGTTGVSAPSTTAPSYIGSAGNPGLPSVSTSAPRTVNSVPATSSYSNTPQKPVLAPKPVSSGAEFPTPSFSGGN